MTCASPMRNMTVLCAAIRTSKDFSLWGTLLPLVFIKDYDSK